jgi:hypothetical protein
MATPPISGGDDIPHETVLWLTSTGEAIMSLLPDRYAEKNAGILSCYDRILIRETLPVVANAPGMTAFLARKRRGRGLGPVNE